MNILLVYPEFPKTTYWSFSHSLPFIGKKASMPPLGLITIAAMLPEYFNLRLVDMNVEKLKDKDLKWADFLFTSSMMIQKESHNFVVKKAKSWGIPVVAGGPYPTQYYDKMDNIDYIIIGEAESGVFDLLINDIINNTPKKAYVKPFIRNNSNEKAIDEKELNNLKNYFGDKIKIITGNERPSMKFSPVPRFDLLKIDKYASMAIQISRGCPFQCEFCNEPTLFGHKVRLKSYNQIINEMTALNDLGFKGSLFVVDDNFIGNIRKIKETLPKIIEFQKQNNYPLTLYTEASINLAKDDELLSLMRDAGFNMVFIGIETPCKKVLESMGKKQNLNTNLVDDIYKIQSYGIEVSGGFIVGNDNDPLDICDIIFDYCQQTAIPTAMVGLLTAIKGSLLYERLFSQGRLIQNSDGNNTHYFNLNFTTLKEKSKEQIISEYENLLLKLYDNTGKNYFARCTKLIENLGYNPAGSRSVGYKEIKALIKSMFLQTFTSYRSSYWKFLINTFFKKRELFPEAVRFAVFGHHFIKITNSAVCAYTLEKYLIKKRDCLYEEIVAIWNKRVEKKEALIRKIMKEKKGIFRKAKKIINKMDYNYRIKLKNTYNNISLFLDINIKILKKYNHFCNRISYAHQKGIYRKDTLVIKSYVDLEKCLNNTNKTLDTLPNYYQYELLHRYNNISLETKYLLSPFENPKKGELF